MKPPRVFNMALLLFVSLTVGFLATSLTGSPVEWMKTTLFASLKMSPKVHAGSFDRENSASAQFQMAKNVRPAAKGESPEDAQLKKLPPEIPPGQLRRPSKVELLNKCAKNPNCKAKLEKAQKRGPNKPLPAAREESPEEKELKKLPKPPSPTRSSQPSGSNLMMPSESNALLSWLNPFQIPSAFAQSAVSIYMTPAGPYSTNPRSYFLLYGVRVYYNNQYRLYGYDNYSASVAENNPYAYLSFPAPANGTYLINYRMTREAAKLRHQSNGPIIATWNFGTQPYGIYDYVTAEYLEQGNHYFYFWTDGAAYIYSVSIESYP